MLVTLDVWTVPPRFVPAAVARMGLDRRALRSTSALTFWKLLGTGSGTTFTPRDASVRRWALLAVWASPAVPAFAPTAAPWARIASDHERWVLRPLASRGRWSGREPFGRPAPSRWDGPVASITRARLVPRRAAAFWRSVPPVSADLQRAPGLLRAFGIGEAPLGLQGTFSVWSSAADLTAYAYRGLPHAAAIRRTAELGWYAEELFARFAVVASPGDRTIAGRIESSVTE